MTFDEIIAKLPKPYYRDEQADIVIYNQDCREILPLIPDKSIDLVLTDPPYGVGLDYGEYQDTQANLKSLVSDCLTHIQRLSQRALITCGVINQWLYPQPTWVLAWFIPTTNSGSSSWGFSCWQPILAYGSDPYLANGRGRQMDYISIMSKRLKGFSHPAVKPDDVWGLTLLRGSVKETDIILDPFLGSGTTAVCAKKLGRKCIGIEIEERYARIAVERLRQSVMHLE